jgi:thiamine biosynthesis protein ThiS
VRVQVNGEPSEVQEGLTVAELIVHLGLPLDGVAAEVNLRVVPRALHGRGRGLSQPPLSRCAIVSRQHSAASSVPLAGACR